MNAKSYLRFLGLAVLTVLTLFYLAMFSIAVWNLFAPDDLCWIAYENSVRCAVLLGIAPLIHICVTIVVLNDLRSNL